MHPSYLLVVRDEDTRKCVRVCSCLIALPHGVLARKSLPIGASNERRRPQGPSIHRQNPHAITRCRSRVAADDVDEENFHLARHGISTHTPYLARHCRRNTFGSLPRGMPTVVDESVEVHVREPDGDTEHRDSDLDMFRPLA